MERVKRSWLARHDERTGMLTFVMILLASIENCEEDRRLIQLDGFLSVGLYCAHKRWRSVVSPTQHICRW